MKMGSFHDRCALHPQRRVVGVCAHCLREHLTSLIESITPADAIDGEDAEETQNRDIGMETTKEQRPQPPPQQPPLLTHPHMHERSANDINTSIQVGRHSRAKPEDSLNLALQKVKHVHQQLGFVAQPPSQVKVAPAASPLIPRVAHEKHVLLPMRHRGSNASESDVRTYPGSMDMLGRKRGSWFSISKAKNSLPNSPLPHHPSKLDDKQVPQKSSQFMILAGRKSASDAIGRNCNKYRQAYMADLEDIAEIKLGEAAIKVDHSDSNRDAHSNSSWISSLFHRRKSSRCKSDVRHHAGSNSSVTDENADAFAPKSSINELPPKASFDAGRLSWDGARPNFKQILKRIEARSKQQRVDCSPMQVADYAMKRYNENIQDSSGQESSLPKCKTVASARSSISVETPKNFRQASPSPMLHTNANAGMDFDNGDFDRDGGPRSRSWGRAWSRTLSPLWGFKHHGRRGVDDSTRQHPGFATPNHVNFKDSLGMPPLSSSYVSPLRRSKRVPDAHIQFAQ
eukprot:c33429_g1_i1 orf=261-1799(+)